MKKTFIIIIGILVLMSCTQKSLHQENDVEEETLPLTMQFTIPESYNEIIDTGEITVNGEVTAIAGEKLKVGDTLSGETLDQKADYFDAVGTGSINDFTGYKLIETVPSLDTPVCTMQTKQLEFAAKEFSSVDFIVISNDTPFALQRFCAANSINNLQVFSDARTREFGKQNGLFLENYGLLTRAIMIVDENNKIEYIEYANEVTSELDLMNALAFLKKQVEK